MTTKRPTVSYYRLFAGYYADWWQGAKRANLDADHFAHHPDWERILNKCRADFANASNGPLCPGTVYADGYAVTMNRRINERNSS